MAMYALSDTTLTALGDAVRGKVGETREDWWYSDMTVVSSPNVTEWGVCNPEPAGEEYSHITIIKAPGAARIHVRIGMYRAPNTALIQVGAVSGESSMGWNGIVNSPDLVRLMAETPNGWAETSGNFLSDTVTVGYSISGGGANLFNADRGFMFEVTAYNAEDNVVPSGVFEERLNTMTVTEMTDAINELSEPPSAENLVITGDCDYRFSNNGWNWFIEKYGNQITTNDISSLAFIFYGSNTLQSIPFELNLQIASYGSLNLNNVFSGCNALQEVPKINNVVRISNMDNLFYNCHKLREIPDDYFDGWNFDGLSNSSAYGNKIGTYLFSGCFSLRKVPIQFFQYDNKQITPYYCAYRNLFTNCYVLDQIVELPVPYTNTAYTTDLLYETFNNLSHLRELTFQTNEDGSPIVVQWKSQTIDLSKYVGYGPNTTYFTAFNSGLLAEDQITTKEQALERVNAETGEPDTSFNAVYRFTLPQSWTTDIAFSRYNRDSARRTLESLPDASAYLATAGGTNTIKFKGDSGSCLVKISSLEETDIAAAVAKGWTVTFV